ncbi:MAG: RNA polymerase sporulation sigma factor SigK [Agathobacter sp.]|nr:RNA polymerase sporulation sigma factor SigK [Agathobacter sp.]
MNTFLPPLTQAQETLCLEKCKNGDAAAKDEFILRNMRLVAHVAKKYATNEDEAQELISVGTIGLIKAVNTFKVDFGSRFATYGIRCIENEILMYFRSRKKLRGEVSLYETIGTDKEGNQIQLVDVLENSDRDIFENVEINTKITKLKESIKNVLSDREYYIIVNRYGLCGCKERTQREIADELNISRSYVSRIEKRALVKLKKIVE